jgi:tetratricopeptide (TPR) repeat protein
MLQFGMCSRCQTEIPEDRLSQRPVVCPTCGFTHNSQEVKAEIQFERRFIKVAVGLALAMILGFIQTATWDKFALEIVPLKIKSGIGMASPTDLKRIVQICLERFRHDCVESAYADLANQGDIEALADLGKFQVRRRNNQNALQTFTQYFKRGGLDLEASYQYAKVLGEVGQTEQSASYFDHVLKARPETLQVTVTQNYVRMLINNGRRDQALKLINSIRKTSPTASMFMQDEYKSLAQANIK